MKIQKILNNNVVITYDSNDKEIIVMGKGIAYGKKVGMDIDPSQITKKFILSSTNYTQNIINVLIDMPLEFIVMTDKIVHYVKSKLSLELHDMVYISILDHIYACIERYKNGISLTNKLLWEIKNFYKDEFKSGLYALKIIKQDLGITLPDDEAGFIALHIISAEKDANLNEVYEITNFIHNITNIVKYFFNLEYDYESFDYNRFITHLKFFSLRLFSKKNNEHKSNNDDLLSLLIEKYNKSYNCSLKIRDYIHNKYNYILDNDEILYLVIHIAKISKEGEQKSV
ncbi:BglG family transcriptional antiterminator [Cricetibacter osteomyelitidis]|uniref:BglG family transcriptional antiterminator n=1 Tax=Cricetibacter osteomyelitidis TaxID=1521931 RepID=A0A4V2T0P0_9PAST|nr:PRD domain-containing protein [Cricetibacter osteomyelitidis]TCP90093.1 BglG family transcriptional antiterminator [Cricetibacter osteomyelitidis]